MPFMAIIYMALYTYKFYKNKKEKRIKRFVDKFSARHKHNGSILKALIPAGITDLKNNREIKNALNRLTPIIKAHPLGGWDDRVEKIKYKVFFHSIENSDIELNKQSIATIISDLENHMK